MKKSSQVLFETSIKKSAAIHSGIISSGTKDIIKITTGATSHSAKSNEWLAEQLLLSFISSAFMRSFLLMADKENIHIEGYDCEGIDDALLTDHIPQVTSINIYPGIYVEDETKRKEVKKLIDITIKNSPAQKMFDAIISYHPVIDVRSNTGILN